MSKTLNVQKPIRFCKVLLMITLAMVVSITVFSQRKKARLATYNCYHGVDKADCSICLPSKSSSNEKIQNYTPSVSSNTETTTSKSQESAEAIAGGISYISGLVYQGRSNRQRRALEKSNLIAELYNKGLEAEQKGRYDVAFRYMKEAAQLGDVDAIWNTGSYYEDGVGVKQDYAQAIYWYKQGAEKGDPSSQFSLATLYDLGEGVKQDLKQALSWYSKCAVQNDKYCQLALGMMYNEGRGVTKNSVKAIDWLEKSATQEFGRAEYELAEYYFKQLKTKESVRKAEHWFLKALQHGILSATIPLFKLYKNDEKAGYAMSTLVSFLANEDKKDNKLAQYYLGLLHELDSSGRIQLDLKLAETYYLKAHNKNYIKATLALASIYWDKKSPLNDDHKAFEFFKLAAEAGHPSAQETLGWMYLEGDCTSQNTEKGMEWLTRSAEQDFDIAELELGEIFIKGSYGISKEISKGLFWLEKAALHENQMAIDLLKEIRK